MDPLEQAREAFVQALAHHNAGRFADAELLYLKAAGLAPRRPSILVNLSAVMISQLRFEEAITWAERALECDPGNPEATRSLEYGRRMLSSGASGTAAGDTPGDYLELGALHASRGDFEAALAAWQDALAIDPQSPRAVAGCAEALARLGRPDEAIVAFHAALSNATANPEAAEALCRLVLQNGLRPEHEDDRFDDLLVRALDAPWAPQEQLVVVAAERLAERRWFREACGRIDAAWPRRILLNIDDDTTCENAAQDPLLRAALENTLVLDGSIQRLLASLRFSLLVMACRLQAGTSSHGPCPDLMRSIAVQCHLNEYVLPEREEESRLVRSLLSRLDRDARAGRSIPGTAMAALAMYLELEQTPLDASLLQDQATAFTRPLLDLHVSRPLQEQRLRQRIPARSRTDAAVPGHAVDAPEMAAHPRWLAVPMPSRRISLDAYASRCLGRVVASGSTAAAGPSRVLQAESRTGQQAILLALQLEDAEVMALDPCRNNLAYAARQANQLSVRNLRFVHGDPVTIAGTGARFDLVDARDALNRLPDPAAGMGVLAGLAVPGGWIRVRLNSLSGRSSILAAREIVSRRGFKPSADGVRAFREFILSLPPSHPARGVTALPAFHSSGGCRQLAFDTDEAAFDLGQLQAMIERHGLRFAGLEIAPWVAKAFVQRFGAVEDWLDLGCWAEFERDHPKTFQGMYRFWLAAPG